MKKQLLTIVFICVVSISQAQQHEFGIFVGGTNYVGDIGKTDYISPNKLGGGIIYKRNINTRIALRGTLSYLPIGADDADATNYFRKNRNFEIKTGAITDTINQFKFKNNIIELAAGIEYNFFEYDIESSDKTLTPYVFLELSGFTYKSSEFDIVKGKFVGKNKISFAIPFGLGFKIKLLNNITFAIETKAVYSFKDDLDSTFLNNLSSNTGLTGKKLEQFNKEFNKELNKQFKDKLKEKINGNGNDWYMFTGFSFVYTFREVFGKPIWDK